MKRLTLILLAASTLALNACAILQGPPQPGQSEAQVIARLGQPSAVYVDGDTRLLSYPLGVFGQYSYMARIGADGRLIAYTQVWTLHNFELIRPGLSTRDDVLRLVGAPTEVMTYARVPYPVWNYDFKESLVWNSQMSIYFDAQGIVQKLENGPDPRYDDNRRP